MMLQGCREGKHSECERSMQRMYFGPKNKIIWLDEYLNCQCSKRGCECFVKATERNKKTRKRKS